MPSEPSLLRLWPPCRPAQHEDPVEMARLRETKGESAPAKPDFYVPEPDASDPPTKRQKRGMPYPVGGIDPAVKA